MQRVYDRMGSRSRERLMESWQNGIAAVLKTDDGESRSEFESRALRHNLKGRYGNY